MTVPDMRVWKEKSWKFMISSYLALEVVIKFKFNSI